MNFLEDQNLIKAFTDFTAKYKGNAYAESAVPDNVLAYVQILSTYNSRRKTKVMS